jgi:hypothetical protein
MEIFWAIVNVAVIAWLSYYAWQRLGRNDTLIYWSSLAVKLGCGIAVGLLYRFYYANNGDTFTFFDDAKALVEYAYTDFGGWVSFLFSGDAPIPIQTTEPRSVFFVAILSVVNLITYNNYWISSLWFSFFSYLCSYRLVRKVDSEFEGVAVAARIALLFVPSVIFWSSGIIKECLAIGSVTILTLHFISIIRGRPLRWFAYPEIILYLYLLVSLKYYWAAVLIPSMITSLIIHWAFMKKVRNIWIQCGLWLAVFAVLSAVASFTHPNFYFERFLSVIIENHDKYVNISRPENTINYYNLSENWLSILLNSPMALWSGLFRPLIFEARTMTSVIGGIENLLILTLVAWKLRYIRMPQQKNRTIVIGAVMYIVVLCVFLALSTPNLGTLSRYRVGFLPFFVLLTLVEHPLLNARDAKYRRGAKSRDGMAGSSK